MEYREPSTQNATIGQKSLALNPTILEPVAPEIESDPDVITLTISEVDRQTALKYNDLEHCLICTALRNRGINADWVGVEGCCIEGERFLFDEPQGVDLAQHANHFAKTAPFYGPEVVGKVIRLRKVR